MKRPYPFASLAGMYFSGCTTSKNAEHCLNREMKGCAPLLEELASTGYLPYNPGHIAAKQFNILTKHLEYPFED